jgi:spore coat protein CotH
LAALLSDLSASSRVVPYLQVLAGSMRQDDSLIPLPHRVLALLVVPAFLLAACGSAGDSSTSEDDGRSLFDTSIVHDVSMSYDQPDYEAMIETFSQTGEKDWIEVTVTIDGETYERAGARLKGNSSLAGLGGAFGPGRGGRPSEDTGESTTTTEQPDNEAANRGPGIGPSGSADADAPADLPWLIRLDQFVDGQDHQGYEDLVIRSNSSETALNEAVALDLLEEAGLASQEAAATSFTVNESEPALRLMIEHPDDDAWYEQTFDADGALYKAESTGDWSYRGDDPAAYEGLFDQEGGSDVADLTPLIEFLQFIDESDDQTFADQLPERVDVEAFATYLAMMDLLGNSDDIDGPGNNAYLWYDAETTQFTIVPWDLNLAFNGGGFGLGGGGGPPMPPMEGELPTDGSLPEDFNPGQLPEGFDPEQLPEGFAPPEGFDPGNLPSEGGAGPRGGFGRSNKLVERFHANAEFENLYQQALTDLRASLYESGVADAILAARVETLNSDAAHLVDSDTVTREANTIAAQFSEAD